jgi:hypothetical protein
MPGENEATDKKVVTIDMTPNWEATAEWFARALAEQAFEQYALDPVISLVEQAGYLGQNDPEALMRVLARLRESAKLQTPRRDRDEDAA